MLSNQNTSANRLLFRALVISLLAGIASGCAVVEPQIQYVTVGGQLVSNTTNNVQLDRAGEILPVGPGTTLQVGDIVRTDANSNAVLLLENGAIEVVLLNSTEVRISSLWVEIGEVFARVKKKLRETFEVESQYGVAAVEGTVFSVRVGGGGTGAPLYECTTLEGQVTLRSRDNQWQSLRLNSGEVAQLTQPGRPAARGISRREFNDLVERMNNVERSFRPASAELIVPNLLGLTVSAARQEAAAFGVTLGEQVPRVTGTAPVGQVVVQDPVAGGRLNPRSSVRIEVEVDPAIVPSVTGSTLAAARRRIEANDLKVGEVTERALLSGTFDRVIEQSEPPNARVVPGTSIDLVVAVEGAEVPSVVGKTEGAAKSQLQSSGLVLGSVSRRRGNGTPDRINDQDPRSGAIVKKGTRVDVELETGCRVPQVVGDSRSTAFQEIRSAGLNPVVSSVGIYNKDNVSGQTPTANQTVTCGSDVRLTFGTNIG